MRTAGRAVLQLVLIVLSQQDCDVVSELIRHLWLNV